jgi:hypothetical protein
VDVENAVELPDGSQADQIENRILLRELVETLRPEDRDLPTKDGWGDVPRKLD